MSRGLAFVGDVHLDRDDPDLEAFLRLLARLGDTASRVVLLGDLFNLWLGDRRIERPHHRAVIEALRGLRARGVVVRYVEGNRDYRIASAYGGDVFDDATDRGLVERFGGRSIYATHGDLANVADRRYRAWRRFSRARATWRLLRLLPAATRAALAESLERRMRGTNVGFKGGFPEPAVREYAGRFLASGHDLVVLGHFHVERELRSAPPDPAGRIVVLPLWKDGRRHLEVDPDGTLRFVASSA